ncbi:MAG: hypothetical protein JNM74_16230 [Myxococcales bacterium]|nr:hypothetical protein [Myxococcales bacterium]
MVPLTKPRLLRSLLASAGLFVVLAGSSLAHAADAISDEARTHFKAGVSLLQDPEGERVEEAYREFKAAYAISKSPKILGNMGFCAMRLERDGEAIEAYSQYLREVPDIDADERAQITRDVSTLSVGVVRVTIKVTAPAGSKVLVSDVRTPVKGEKITNAYPFEIAPGQTSVSVSLGVRSGHHVMTVRSPGFVDETWELDALAGSKESREVTLKAPPKDAPPPPVVTRPEAPPAEPSRSIAPWVVAGVGGAMMAVGAVTGVVALGKESDIANACPNDVCPAAFDLAGARSSAKTFIGVTDVLLIGGGVVLAGGITWALLSSPSSAPKAGALPRKRTPELAGACGPTGCSGTLKVTF